MSLDLALVGGRVRTLDPDRRGASAVGISGGTIVAVGDDAEIRAAADARTETIDLRGAAVIPGIADSHLHPFMGALNARGADLMDARTLDDVRRAATVSPHVAPAPGPAAPAPARLPPRHARGRRGPA